MSVEAWVSFGTAIILALVAGAAGWMSRIDRMVTRIDQALKTSGEDFQDLKREKESEHAHLWDAHTIDARELGSLSQRVAKIEAVTWRVERGSRLRSDEGEGDGSGGGSGGGGGGQNGG